MGNFDFSVQEYLTILQRITKVKVNKIKENNERYSKLKNNLSEEGKSIVAENTQLVRENNEMLNLHVQIINIRNKYLDQFNSILHNKSASINITSNIDRNVALEKTKKDEIILNDTHPFINDNDFLEELLSYFIDTENYEGCEKIKKYIK